MKKMICVLIIFITVYSAYSQPKLIIHKKDGTSTMVELAKIDSITFSQVSLPDTLGLLAFYPFDGSVDDATGHGYNGVNHGATFADDRFSHPNKALFFSGGSSSYVTTSNTGTLPLNDAFSICFWMKFQQSGIVIEKDIVGTFSTDWNVKCDATGKIGFEFGTIAPVWSNSNLNSNWHFIVFLRNKSTGVFKIYIDGILDREASGLVNNLTGTANLNFGAWENPTAFNDGFTGSLDQIRFYSREITEAEIQSLLNEN